MKSFEWLLVLVPILVVGIYLIFRRSGAKAPLNTIYQSTAERTYPEAGSESYRADNDPSARSHRAHGGCCGLTR